MKKVLLIFCCLFFCCKKRETKEFENIKDKKERVIKAISVTTSKIPSINFTEQIKINGKINAIQKSNLSFIIQNKLSFINVQNGQTVSKNYILAELENDVLKNEVEKAHIELQKAKNKLTLEKINYGKDSISSTLLKKFKIKSGLLDVKNHLEKVQIKLRQTLLRAPFSGVIANLEKKQGDFITSSDVFCTIINPNALEVSFSILENEFNFVSKGQQVEIQSFVNNDDVFKGVITEINPIVDKNGLIKIKANVTSKSTGLLDGMNVKVLINKPFKDALVIPKEAIVIRSNKEVVFTVENGSAKWNNVEIMAENNESYAIKKGLQINDTIIVSGNLNLAHDAKVNATFVHKKMTQKK